MKNENKITQLKMYFDLDKEIEYINSMNKKGWKLVYVKLGCLYTFIKSKPDEYVTMYYAEQKENISKIQAFAAQCGYESIPHSNDGFGDLLYLTGRKSEISDEFVCDIDSQIASSERIHKKFRILSIVYIVIDIIMWLETCFFLITAHFISNSGEDAGFVIGFTAVITVITVLLSAMTINVVKIVCKVKKRIEKLMADKAIYE